MDNKAKRLLARFEEAFNGLSQAVDRFPWEDRTAYAHWIGQTYYFVDHTTVFLSLIAAKYGIEAKRAHLETLHHLREESGHEKMALADLKAMGFEISQIPELGETALLYQNQYYWIERRGPTSHAGYSLMLEGIAGRQGDKITKRIEQAHGKGTAKFLKVHVTADKDHFAEGVERLSHASDTEIEQVLKNLDQSCLLYQAMLNAIVAHCYGMKKKAA